MNTQATVVGELRLTGDITAADWVRWLGVPWSEYTEPVRVEKERLRIGMSIKAGVTTHPARCDLVRDRFNRMVDQSGALSPRELEDAVLRYYAGDWYDRIMALDAGETGLLANSSHTAESNWEGEPHQALLRLTEEEFSESPEPKEIYVHGIGHGELLLGMASDKGIRQGYVYVANDVWSPTRALIVDAIRRHTNVTLYDHWLPPFSTTSGLRPGSAHAVHTCEVLEHIPNPDRVLFGLARALKMGGYMMCSTFFNDMDGHDPQHLLANNVYQDTDKWFAVLERAGLRKAWADPRGVWKIWKKVESPDVFVSDID